MVCVCVWCVCGMCVFGGGVCVSFGVNLCVECECVWYDSVG